MTNTDNLLDTDTALMVREAGTDAIQSWSDDRRKEFCNTFDQRSKCAQYILIATASQLKRLGTDKYILDRSEEYRFPTCHLYDIISGNGYTRHAGTVSGRSQEELFQIAKERADRIISELPEAKKAIRIIQPDVAKMMDERDAIKKKGQSVIDELNQISEPINLADVDQKMTVGEFRKFAKDREKRRKNLVNLLTELGDEGSALENQINKRLYKGIPGLREALDKVIQSHLDKAKGFSETTRRVQEKVMFGDSVAAQELLRTFEADEVSISDTVRTELRMAVQALLGPAAKPAKKGKKS